MLKNRKTLYVLLPVNLFIWGYFVCKVLGVGNFGDNKVPQPVQRQLSEATISMSLPEYTIRGGYADPFLKDGPRLSKTYHISNIRGRHTGSSVPDQLLKINQPTQMPQLQFFGLVTNSKSGSSTALISYNGESKTAKKGEVIGELRVVAFDHDSIVFALGKNRHAIGLMKP